MRHHTLWLSQLLLFVTTILADEGNWTQPNGQLPSFSETYTIGERIFLSWLNLNDSVNDLWLTRFDLAVDHFAVRLDVACNLSAQNSFEWNIGIEDSVVHEDTRFILQFLPTGSLYNASAPPQLPSPPFNVIALGQLSTPNGTVGAPSITSTATAAATQSQGFTSSSSTSSESNVPPPMTNSDPPIGRNIAIGIAVGAALVVLASVGTAIFVIRVYRKKKAVQVEANSDEDNISGPYEILGSKRQPTELSSKETMVHEMTCSKESIASELESPIVYEIATTTKKPGLHELPA